jgi:hypothetical protein
LIRRRLLQGLGAAAATLLCGHTPYGQWTVYRKKHLLIGCHRQDPRTYELAKQVVAVLAEHLPSAKARPARAPTLGRLASLLGTDQLHVSVLGWADAERMAAGTAEFRPYGEIPLQLIAPVGEHALIAHSSLPKRHVWLVAAALSESAFVKDASIGANPLPWHVGAEALRKGEPEPSAD